MKKVLLGFIISLFLIQNLFSAVPVTFTNATVADATEVNSNFTYFENKFSTTSGHDHDNSDSKLITTTGTITSGEWRGTIIDDTYGGTGLSTYATGDLIAATSDIALTTIATADLGNVLLAQGNFIPAWGQVNLGTTVTGILPIARGGTGQSSAQAAIDALLPSQSGNSGKFLTSNGSISSWDVGNASNVIFIWLGSTNATTNVFGRVEGASLTPAMSTYTVNYEFFGVLGSTYRTILTGRFVKIAGISTVTIHANLWATSGNNSQATLSVDVGGQSNTVQSAIASTTPTWVTTSTINVSSLTNGTAYDITIQLKDAQVSPAESVYCAGVILTGS